MKKTISFILVLVIIIASVPFGAGLAAGNVNAQITRNTIKLDGEEVYIPGFLINNNNYFKLRDLASCFSGTLSKFDVEWNAEKGMIVITTGRDYTPDPSNEARYYFESTRYTVTPAVTDLLIDGAYTTLSTYNINGSNFVQLRDLSAHIPYEVEWDAESSTVLLYSKLPDNARKLARVDAGTSNAVSSYFPNWASTVESYVFQNYDGSMSIMECVSDTNGNAIKIDTYNSGYELISTKTIEYELPIFGGFLKGESGYYIAFGQNNSEENDSKEVIRIVKYDANFNRISSVSVKNCYTVTPFASASGRMAESGGTLVFHTSRRRYKSSDGVNHQSQLTILIDTSNMRVMNENDLGAFQRNHVSHSFDQYVLFDGGSYVLLDHGDAHPRSIVLSKSSVGSSSYSEINMFNIPGETGANATGVSVGGFEASASSYIVAMNTIDHSLATKYTSGGIAGLELDQRDIILCVLPKSGQSDSAVRQITLQRYVGTSKIASIPQLVKISDYRMMVLWQEFEYVSAFEVLRGDVKYVMIDENGNTVGDVETLENFHLSKCKPTVIGGEVVWYTSQDGSRILYSVDY